MDESRTAPGPEAAPGPAQASPPGLSEIEGLEFVLAFERGESDPKVARGLENPKPMAAWAQVSLAGFRSLGERLRAGPLEQLEGLGPQRQVALAGQGDLEFCVGWRPTLAASRVRTLMNKVLSLWAS